MLKVLTKCLNWLQRSCNYGKNLRWLTMAIFCVCVCVGGVRGEWWWWWWGGGGKCGTGVGAIISKPIPFIYLTFEKMDPFIYLIIQNVDIFIYCPLICVPIYCWKSDKYSSQFIEYQENKQP